MSRDGARIFRGTAALVIVTASLVVLAGRSAGAQEEVSRPTVQQCKDDASNIGFFQLGSSIGSVCSKATSWFPGNKGRCCDKLYEYFGDGGDLAYCLCDNESAEYLSSKLDDVFVHLEDVIGNCGDAVFPYRDSSTCPPAGERKEEGEEAEDGSSPSAGVGGEDAPSDPSDVPADASIPSQAECIAAAEEIGQQALTSSLAGCFFGATNGCCGKASRLLGAGGALELCLCDPESARFITDEAKNFGIDVEGLMRSCLGKGYEVPFTFNEYCPEAESPVELTSAPPSGPKPVTATAAPSPAPTPEPPQEDKDAPSGLSDRPGLPTLGDCVAAAEAIGQDVIVGKVLPCIMGPSAECCSAAVSLVGKGGQLQNCLCDEEAARLFTDETEKMSFDLQGILAGCVQDQQSELPFFGNEYCPATAEDSMSSLPNADEPSGPSEPVELFPPLAEDGVPSLFQCGQLFERAGGPDLISSFTPCLSGPSADCCNAVAAVAGPSGGMAYCLCNQEVEDAMFELAGDLQMDDLGTILRSCSDVPLKQSGNCPKESEESFLTNEAGLSLTELQQRDTAGAFIRDTENASEQRPAAPLNDGSGLPAWVVPSAVVAGAVLVSLAAVALWALVIAPAQAKARAAKTREERGKQVVSQPTLQGAASTSTAV